MSTLNASAQFHKCGMIRNLLECIFVAPVIDANSISHVFVNCGFDGSNFSKRIDIAVSIFREH